MATVQQQSGFNPEADAQALRKAMKGVGTDEKAIITIITARTNRQRQEIKSTYKQSFGRDLVDDLKSELSGHFENVVVALFMEPRHYDAKCLKKAMKGLGTDEATLIEILVTRNNEEIKEINRIYKQTYDTSLEKALSSETSGHFKRLLISLNNGARDTDSAVNGNLAATEANELYEAGEKQWGTDESVFNRIMAVRSFPQLRATFDEYKQVAKKDITNSIKSEFSGDIETGMLAIVETARNVHLYFAELLYKSMKGLGTDEDVLTRVIVSRSEIDMQQIKAEFAGKYGKSLASFISSDTSGDYKKILLGLIGN